MKQFSLNFFIISYNKVAKLSNEDFLSVCIFIITYNEVAEISKDINDDKYTQNLFKNIFPDSDFPKQCHYQYQLQ